MRLTYALLMLGLAGACSDDDYPTPAGGDRDAAAPSADADPTAPDADLTAPDADPTAPDAGPADATQTNDRKGPTIDVTSPAAPDLMVSGVMILEFEVIDVDGVDLASVGASIRGNLNQPIPFELEPSGPGTWIGTFDTTVLAGRVFPVIEIVALDIPGNKTEFGMRIELDNMPPIAELDPPRIRQSQLDELDFLQCSQSFDPVGPDAPSDGESVAQFIELRARIEDRPNDGTSSSTVIVPLAGVDPDRVELLVLDDSSQPLIVDSNGDGRCDAVNPSVVPRRVPTASNEAAVVNLAPIAPIGDARFLAADQPQDPMVGDNLACGFVEEEEAVSQVCLAANGVTRIPAVSGTASTAMIYAPPANARPDACMGDFFDGPGANLSDGWACVAVRVSDREGNTSVSPPLRICVDGDRASDPSPECLPYRQIAPVGERPSCTGTVVAGTVTATPCTFDESRLFRRGDPGEYELVQLP